MKRTGFTLIELLVVIAIIAILAAILFPVFARARAKAQQTQCLSNIKQIAMAEKMYAADFADRYAPWNCDSRYYWLNPYVGIQNLKAPFSTAQINAAIAKGWQIWKCPAAPPPWDTYHVGYSLNDYGDGQNWTWFLQAEGEIADSANVIMWGDGGWNLGWNTTTGIPNSCNTRVLQGVGAPSTAALDAGLTADPPYWPYRNTTGQFAFIGRHNGLCNFNFCDGHAKAMRLDEVKSKVVLGYYYYFTWIRPNTG